MDDSHPNDRLTRLEVSHEHMEKMLDQLVKTTDKVGQAVTLLANHQEVLTKLNDAREDHSTRITLCETQLEAVKDLPEQVSRNTTVTKAGIWAAGALITVALGVIATKVT